MFLLIDFAEKLFKQLEDSKERFEVKIMMMELISRLAGIHEVKKSGLVLNYSSRDGFSSIFDSCNRIRGDFFVHV